MDVIANLKAGEPVVCIRYRERMPVAARGTFEGRDPDSGMALVRFNVSQGETEVAAVEQDLVARDEGDAFAQASDAAARSGARLAEARMSEHSALAVWFAVLNG